MSIAHLGKQVSRAVAAGYPQDGSRALPRRLERLCTLVASEEHTVVEVARQLRVTGRTVQRVRRLPLVSARIAHLREQVRQAAYDAEPLVDKRNRIVVAGQLARTLHDEGERQQWRETLAVTKQGTPITGFDWRRVDQLRQLLDYIAKEAGDRAPGPQGGAGRTDVGVSLTMDDAVLRVQALFSRIDAPPVNVADDAAQRGDDHAIAR